MIDTIPDLFQIGSVNKGAAPMSDSAASYAPPMALPPTSKQILFARQLAMQTGAVLPWQVQQDRRALSRWIDAQKACALNSDAAHRPTSKQVAFAERLATIKRTNVPDECFRDRQMLSRWIDSHKH
jgi:hypothetical protein